MLPMPSAWAVGHGLGGAMRCPGTPAVLTPLNHTNHTLRAYLLVYPVSLGTAMPGRCKDHLVSDNSGNDILWSSESSVTIKKGCHMVFVIELNKHGPRHGCEHAAG